MNEQRDSTAKTLTLLFPKRADNSNDGALSCNGGGTFKKNLHVHQEVVCNELIAKDGARINGDINLNGHIKSNDITYIPDSDELLVQHNMVPSIKTTRHNLGSIKKRWANIYGKFIDIFNIKSHHIETQHLNVHGDVSIGSDIKDQPLISMKKYDDTIGIQGKMIFGNDNNEITLYLDNKTGIIKCNNIQTNNMYLSEYMCFEIYNYTNKIIINKPIVMLNLYITTDANINLGIRQYY